MGEGEGGAVDSRGRDVDRAGLPNIPSRRGADSAIPLRPAVFSAQSLAGVKEFWNPDVFGYNGQLPQIMRIAGIERFLTQKLSWNKFTKPPYHTFTWEGIDGSKVLAQFPPADTYNANASVQQLRHNAANYKDHDRSRNSFYLFGIGDGGGGPTKQMIEVLERPGPSGPAAQPMQQQRRILRSAGKGSPRSQTLDSGGRAVFSFIAGRTRPRRPTSATTARASFCCTMWIFCRRSRRKKRCRAPFFIRRRNSIACGSLCC